MNTAAAACSAPGEEITPSAFVFLTAEQNIPFFNKICRQQLTADSAEILSEVQ